MMRHPLPFTLALIALLAFSCAKREAQAPAKEPVAEEKKPAFAEQPLPADPAPAKPAPPPPAAIQPSYGFRVQVFGSGTRDNALRMAEKARYDFKDQQVFVKQASLNDQPYFKVLVGNFPAKADADALKAKALALGFPGAFVFEVRPDQ